MGNDGGSIPTRRELVKSAARLPTVSELKATALEALTHAWQTDPITGNALDLDAVVSDWRGRLFNYETILEGLLPDAQAADGDAAGQEEDGIAPAEGVLTVASVGIRSVRDVVRLHCKRASQQHDALWQCPVTLKELGPGAKSVYLVPCGHVFADAAVDKILPDKQCPECNAELSAENVVPILPTDEADLARLRQRMEKLRADGLTHSLKKDKVKKDKSLHHHHHHGDKKNKKRKAGAGGQDESKKTTEEPKKKKEKKDAMASRISGINNPLAASLTAKVLAEQDERQRRRKLAEIR